MKRRWLVLQAGLIVLPVMILSGTSFYFLREDRGAIEQDAREQAQRLAPPMAGAFGSRIAELVRGNARGEIASNGGIVSPKDYAPLPEPAAWPGELSPSLAASWAEAQDAIFRRQDKPAARRILRRLSSAPASRALRLNAELGLLRLDPDASRAIALAGKSRGVTTESGTPVSHLAWLIALQEGGPAAGLEATLRDDPGFLVPDLLDAAARTARSPEDRQRVEGLRQVWKDREGNLRVLRMRRSLQPVGAGERWFDFGGEPHLAVTAASPRGWSVSAIPQPLVEKAFRDVVEENRDRIPAYVAAALEIGGRRFPAGSRGKVLAAAASAGTHPFTWSLDLGAPELLFRGYGRRWWLTAGLILSAGVAALLALASMWRGFQRQVRLTQMKSDFVSSVSHELRAPIAAVQLMAESLEHGRITGAAKQRDYYHLIVQECRRLSVLVENVLDLSRIDRASKQYRFEPVDVAALLRRTVALMEPIAREREVDIAMIEPEGDAAVQRPLWDDHAVEQTLVNLLDNAIKHSPAGSCVKAGIEIANAGTIRVWVEDQGEGIPTEAQAQIFELFYRHSRHGRHGTELRRETTGVGIGLSIVKHVAEAHGGRVLVASTVGQGSRFALELPVSVPK